MLTVILTTPVGSGDALAAGVDHPDDPLLKFFFTFQIIGGVGVTAILVTAALSDRIRRHAVWMSFNLTWIISVLSYCLLYVRSPPSQQ